MTTQELLALPLGTNVSWDEMSTTGTVSVVSNWGLTFRWADGQETIVTNEDDDLSEFAGTLEVLVAESVEEPIFVGRIYG